MSTRTKYPSQISQHTAPTHHLYLLPILIVYVALSLYQINLPGLHYDEAFEAVPALQLLLGRPVTAFRDSGLVIGNQLFPFMTQDYIGAINTYAAIPFIAMFGSTPAALRVMSILIGSATLWLTYTLGYTLSTNRRVGLTAALLLAVDPTFIFWNRQGIFVTAITATLGLAATLCWLRRWQYGSVRWSVAGAFLVGLGLYAKFLFLWLIAALLAAIILLNLPELVKVRFDFLHRSRIRKTEAILTGMAFLLGCWPLLAYNLQTGGTFFSIFQNAQTSYYGVNNLALGINLVERVKQFVIVLNGGHLWYLGDVVSNSLPLFGFILVLVGIILIAIRNKLNGVAIPKPWSLKKPLKIALFPFLVIGLVIFASIGTVSALWVTHFAILMPWPAMAIAVGSWFIFYQIQPKYHQLRVTIPILTGVGLGLLVVTNLFSVIRYHQALAESGGLSAHSDAVYDLSHWLSTHADGPVIAMDWGLAAPVTYLTHGRVAPTEIFGYAWEPAPNLTNQLADFIQQPPTLYLWRSPDEIIFDRSQEFKALYRPLDLEETIEAAFYERSGRPILGITRLVPQGTAENPPK